MKLSDFGKAFNEGREKARKEAEEAREKRKRKNTEKK